MEKIIELKNISKSFDGEVVLDNISLDIHDNEFITLLGPSGCGKTTTLRIIGGFVYPDQGDVLFMGERINDVPPHKRNVNTVFQKYALFPHLNVFENVAFPLREKKVPKKEIKEKVDKMLSMVMLSGFATPISSMPEIFQDLTLLNPMRYGLELIQRIFLEGAGFLDLWPLFAAIMTVTVVAVLAAIFSFHHKIS